MKMRWIAALALTIALAVAGGVSAQGTEVTIIESWFIHNESMGDPIGVEKGFFGNLKVNVVGGGPGLSPIDRVMAEARRGKIVFGVDYPYNILEARTRQRLPLVAIGHDFQKSAIHLLSWEPLKSAKDVRGTVATWIGYDKQIKAMIGPNWSKQIRVVNQQGDPATIGAWVKKQYKFAHAMGYNEVIVAKRVVKERYYVYSYADDFGMQWPENVLFTTEDVIRRNPQVVSQFVKGRYQGFKYGLANREEAAEILLKYNKNLEREHEIAGMPFLEQIITGGKARTQGLGYVDPAAWARVAQDLTKAGIYKTTPNYRAAYSTRFPSGVKP